MTYKTINELDVTGALAVAVTSAVLGTSGVARVLGQTTIGVHGNEVEGTVQTAANTGNIHVKGELVAQQGEHLVGLVVLHEVHAAANVGAVLALGDELEAEGVAAGDGAVGGGVLGTVEAALLGAGGAVSADGLVPGVAVVAVGVAGELVSPSPVGVDGDGALDFGAGAGRALGPGQRGVSLGSQSAGLLGSDGGDERRGGGDGAIHDGLGRAGGVVEKRLAGVGWKKGYQWKKGQRAHLYTRRCDVRGSMAVFTVISTHPRSRLLLQVPCRLAPLG